MEVKKEVMRCAQDNTYSFVHFCRRLRGMPAELDEATP